MNIDAMTIVVSETADGLTGTGLIETIRARLKFDLEPVPMRSENSPTHALLYVKPGSAPVRIGAAWQGELKRGDKKGAPFFSMKFDDPDLPEWLEQVSAFPTDDPEVFRIDINRKRGGRDDDQKGETA